MMATTEIEGKIPDFINVDTKTTISSKATEIENKIPNTASFITTPKFNRLMKISFDARNQKLCEQN